MSWFGKKWTYDPPTVMRLADDGTYCVWSHDKRNIEEWVRREKRDHECPDFRDLKYKTDGEIWAFQRLMDKLKEIEARLPEREKN